MSAEERERPRAWHQSPSMSELLASCAAADAISKPPERPAAAERAVSEPAAGSTQDAAERSVPAETVRRDAA
jgi:hypothetical protein